MTDAEREAQIRHSYTPDYGGDAVFLLRLLDAARACPMTGFEMVREFLQANGKECPETPTPLRGDLLYWDRLDEEETREYHEARLEGQMEQIAKELADRIYILLGHAVTMGLVNFDAIFAEVHRSNMSKLGADGKPVLRADGKIMKGDAYAPPDLRALVGERI